MKRVLLAALSLGCLLSACNSDTKIVQEKSESANAAKVKSVAAPVDPTVQKIEELKKLPILGLDELANWLPSELNGIKRSNFTMSSDMGYPVAHADYTKNNKTDIRVTVYDCAGETGSSVYKATYADKLKEPAEDADSYTKIIDLRGHKAIEHHEKKNKITTLTYMANDRVLVVVSARNYEPEQIREASQQLHQH
jgi:hypothetical protein